MVQIVYRQHILYPLIPSAEVTLELLEEQEQKNGKSGATCPEFRSTFEMKALMINYAMDKITSNLEVKCMNAERKWSGILTEAEDHNRQCPRRAKVSCPLGCGEKLPW